jgi:hypothetical protein
MDTLSNTAADVNERGDSIFSTEMEHLEQLHAEYSLILSMLPAIPEHALNANVALRMGKLEDHIKSRMFIVEGTMQRLRVPDA